MKNSIKFMASNLLLATGSVYDNTTVTKNSIDVIEWNGTSTNYSTLLDHYIEDISVFGKIESTVGHTEIERVETRV
jgi:hypothetical protein